MSLFGKRNVEADTRAQTDQERLARGGLPLGAELRLKDIRQNGKFFTSNLSVNELAQAATQGVQPLGQVMGSTIYHVGLQYTPMYQSAERLERQAHAWGENLLEFAARGTAIATALLLWSTSAFSQVTPTSPINSGNQPPRYTIVNLTSIGGPHPYGRVSIASLNKSGQIAGYFNDIKGKTDQLTSQAFVWKDGKTTLLPPPPGFSYCIALAQNDSGLVVGQARNNMRDVKVNGKTVEKGGDACACVWEKGQPRRLKALGTGNSGAEAVNNQGDIVGHYTVITGKGPVEHACIWKRGGKFVNLGPAPPVPGKIQALGWVAMRVNDQDQVLGQIAGGEEGQAGPTFVFWEKGHIRVATAQDKYLMFHVKNKRGQVLRGSVMVSKGNVVSFHWLGRSAHGLDLNDAGQVVGGMPAVKLNLPPWAQRSNYDDHAFLWEAGQIHDLNEMISPTEGLVLTEAMNIDNQGRILVWANRSMADGPLLLVPVPK